MEDPDSQQVLSKAYHLWKKHTSTTNRNSSHLILENADVSVCIIPKMKESYDDISLRPQQRRKQGMKAISSLYKMTESNVLDFATSSSFIKSNQLRDIISDPTSKTSINLMKCGVPKPLDDIHSVALLLTREFSERDAEFIRRYFGALPPVKKLRLARRKLLKSLPHIYILAKSTGAWKSLPEQIDALNSADMRDIICARVGLKDAMTNYLKSSKETDSWPFPPKIESSNSFDVATSLIFELSIDSGGGTTKMMGKFISNRSGQLGSDIILLAEAHGISETFEDLSRIFGVYSDELKSIITEGLIIDAVNYNCQMFFVGDFQVYYAILGMYTAGSKQPCPWCRIPLNKLDRFVDNIHETELLPRDAMVDKSNITVDTDWQKRNTYNFLSLTVQMNSISNALLVVPPPLHMKIGIINKIVKSLDLIVKELDKKHKLNMNEESAFGYLLAASLSKIGARREKYYAGNMSGVPCSNLLENMHQFCTLFFDTDVEVYGSVLDNFPFLASVRENLEKVGAVWVDSSDGSGRGLGFFFHYQGKWDNAMIKCWDETSILFVKFLKDAIWRPAGKSRTVVENSFYKVPMRMPKLHTLLAHVTDFVRLTGYWALYGEEGFEHYQQICKKIGNRHSFNLPVGGQICRNLKYAWLKSLPLVSFLQAEAEDTAVSSGSRISKRKFRQ